MATLYVVEQRSRFYVLADSAEQVQAAIDDGRIDPDVTEHHRRDIAVVAEDHGLIEADADARRFPTSPAPSLATRPAPPRFPAWLAATARTHATQPPRPRRTRQRQCAPSQGRPAHAGTPSPAQFPTTALAWRPSPTRANFPLPSAA